MENKKVGYLILGIAALLVIIIFLFKDALKQIVSLSCFEHGTSCPMYTTINQQTILALIIVGILVALAVFLIFSKPDERIIVRKIKENSGKYPIIEAGSLLSRADTLSPWPSGITMKKDILAA